MLLLSSSVFGAKKQEEPKGYPIDSEVFTTLERTIVPDPKPATEINLHEISKYKNDRKDKENVFKKSFYK